MRATNEVSHAVHSRSTAFRILKYRVRAYPVFVSSILLFLEAYVCLSPVLQSKSFLLLLQVFVGCLVAFDLL